MSNTQATQATQVAANFGDLPAAAPFTITGEHGQDYTAQEFVVTYEGNTYRAWAPAVCQLDTIDDFLDSRKMLSEMTKYEPTDPDVTQLEEVHRASLAKGLGESSAAMVVAWAVCFQRQFWPSISRELAKVEDDNLVRELVLRGIEQIHENIVAGRITGPWAAVCSDEVGEVTNG